MTSPMPIRVTPEAVSKNSSLSNTQRYLFAGMAVALKSAVWPDFEIGKLCGTEGNRPKPCAGFVASKP